jgi:hypothetical protein
MVNSLALAEIAILTIRSVDGQRGDGGEDEGFHGLFSFRGSDLSPMSISRRMASARLG